MKRKTQKILSLLLVAALVIGMLSVGIISAGASSATFYGLPLVLNDVKIITDTEAGDTHYLNYTPDRDITVEMESYGDFNTCVSLYQNYDSDREFISGSGEGGGGYNFHMVNQLKAGETYTYVIYCLRAYTADGADSFSLRFSEVIIPSDAVELTAESSTDFVLTADNNDIWYRFTADDTCKYRFNTSRQTKGDYRLWTNLYDENMNLVEDDSNSRLTNIHLLEKDKTYYFNLRLIEIADDLEEVSGTVALNYDKVWKNIPEMNAFTQNEVVRVEKSREGEEYCYYYTPSSIEGSFTPKESGTYRIYFDHIYADWGFGTGVAYDAYVYVYNGNRRFLYSSYITTDEAGDLCTTEFNLNANETYYLDIILNHYAFYPYHCEFHISEICSNHPLTYLLGDADDNGTVDSVDTVFIQRGLAGMEMDVPEKTLLQNGDADQSGDLDVIDATLIQRFLAKMTVNFPINEAFISKRIIHVSA